jgi:hypothetical protein
MLMSVMPRIRKLVVPIAIAAALLVSAAGSSAAPSAHTSGAIVNYLTSGKLKVAKQIAVPFECSVACNVISKVTVKGPKVKGSQTTQVAVPADQPSGHFIKLKPGALKRVKASPGKYKVISKITATDAGTGAMDAIAHTFGLKRP